jgi:hypothetical protein
VKLAELPDRLDLGEGRWLTFFGWQGDDVVGALETHPSAKDTQFHKAGQECAGGLYFDVPEKPPALQGQFWAVESWQPLTLSPSVLCRICGNHGFIREGQWVPA